jgi:hypothetical protein
LWSFVFRVVLFAYIDLFARMPELLCKVHLYFLVWLKQAVREVTLHVL